MPCTQISGLGAHTCNPKWVHNPINGLAACGRPHLKALVLNNSHIATAHRALQGLLTLYEKGRMSSRRLEETAVTRKT